MITRNRPVAFRRKEMLLVATEAGNMCVCIYVMCIYIVHTYTHNNSWHGQRKIVCNQRINSFEISKTTFPTFQKAFVVVDGWSWTPVYLLPANPRNKSVTVEISIVYYSESLDSFDKNPTGPRSLRIKP